MRTTIAIAALVAALILSGCKSDSYETVGIDADTSAAPAQPGGQPAGEGPTPVANKEELTINPNAKIEGPGGRL